MKYGSLDSSNQSNFVNPISFVITLLEFHKHNAWFYQLRHRQRSAFQSGNSGGFCPHYVIAQCCKKLVFLPELSLLDTRLTRNNLTTKFKTLATNLWGAVKIFSVVKIAPNFQVLKTNGIPKKLTGAIFLFLSPLS